MREKNIQGTQWIFIIWLLIFPLACTPSQTTTTITSPLATPTNTPLPVIDSQPTSTPITDKCENISGELAMQILVGPAEAVGLEPVAVGKIPFKVINEEGSYLIQGDGTIVYEAQLQEAWGTYTITLDMDAEVTGECLASEMLDLIVTASGNQMVEVRADGFSGDYPWEGTNTLELNFPLQDGASAEGEGWVFILHLTQ